MKSISEFFQRIRAKQARGVFIQMAIKEVVKERTGVEADAAKISFSGMDVVIKGLDQSAKSVIFIKKPAILLAIESQKLGRIVRDIRLP